MIGRNSLEKWEFFNEQGLVYNRCSEGHLSVSSNMERILFAIANGKKRYTEKDVFDIYEVKYLVTPMTQKQIQEEIRQVAEIKGIRVGEVGFISISGFESDNDEYICLDGDSLYQ